MPRFADQPRRDPRVRQVTPQANDVGAKLLGGELGRAPGKADKLRCRKELPGTPGEERQQLGLATGKRQPLPRVAEHASPDVEVEAGQLPQPALPEVEPRLQPAQMTLHPTLVRIAGPRPLGRT